MTEVEIIKYPRTQHLVGSRLQPGDEDLSQIPFSEIIGKHIVIEEKIDGANTAVSFDTDGTLLLQSRGHYLSGGYRERHYNLFKQWANVHHDSLYELLGTRYIMYGEWMYAKHTVFYDMLPNYFMEFDILDRETGKFFDTKTRHEMLKGYPISSVPVLAEGEFNSKEDILKYLGRSNYISDDHLLNLKKAAEEMGLDVDRQLYETSADNLMEGLYIKREENGEVVGRVKFVRNAFYQTVQNSETHWLERPIIPNQLAVPTESLFETGDR